MSAYDASRIRQMIRELEQIAQLKVSEDTHDRRAGDEWFQSTFGDGEKLQFLELTAQGEDAYMRDLAQQALAAYDQSPGGEKRRRRLAYEAEAPQVAQKLERTIAELQEVLRLTRGPNASYQQRGDALFQTKFADGTRLGLVTKVYNGEDYPAHVRQLARRALDLYNLAPPLRPRPQQPQPEATNELFEAEDEDMPPRSSPLRVLLLMILIALGMVAYLYLTGRFELPFDVPATIENLRR